MKSTKDINTSWQVAKSMTGIGAHALIIVSYFLPTYFLGTFNDIKEAIYWWQLLALDCGQKRD